MKERILIITTKLPYPPINGYKLKNYNLLKILSKYFEVHLVTITEEKMDKEAELFLKEHTFSYKIFRKSRFDFMFSAMKTLFNNDPLQVNYYYFRDVQKYINSICKNMNLLISVLIRTAKYIEYYEKPKIFDMADSIGQNYKRSQKNVKSVFWKNIYKFEADRLINYEKKLIDKFDKTFLFNKEEINFFSRYEKIILIPHGVNEDLLSYEKINLKYTNSIGFIGKMDYQPNIDAVIWFIENIIPNLNSNINFYIIGANPTDKVLKYASKYKNIIVTGFVEDPYEILNSTLCNIAPMQTGAGIQNKLLETMALGTINIVSSLAAIPIGAVCNEDYIVLDNPIDITNKINEIMINKDKFNSFKVNSRDFIRENFTWDIYEKLYINTIKEILYENTK